MWGQIDVYLRVCYLHFSLSLTVDVTSIKVHDIVLDMFKRNRMSRDNRCGSFMILIPLRDIHTLVRTIESGALIQPDNLQFTVSFRS